MNMYFLGRLGENWAFWGDPQSGTVLVLLLSTPCLDAAGG